MKIKDAFGGTLDESLYATDTKLVDSDTFVGIECEIEGVNRISFKQHLNTFFWRVTTDGSLRNGCEPVFSKPLKGANVTAALSSFDEAVAAREASGQPIELSRRTSMHVHIDVRDLSTEEIHDLIAIYMLFERLLFDYVGTYRSKNNYCRPLVGSNFSKVLTDMKDHNQLDYYMDFVSNMCDKYSALNVRAIATFGSLEFRHHPGVTSSSEIYPWLNILLSLKLWIKKGNSVQSLIELSAYEAIVEVFGELSSLLTTSGYITMYDMNRSAVRELLNYRELTGMTSKILAKNSRAKNRLIDNYQEVSV